jgi:hypothetical protein
MTANNSKSVIVEEITPRELAIREFLTLERAGCEHVPLHTGGPLGSLFQEEKSIVAMWGTCSGLVAPTY